MENVAHIDAAISAMRANEPHEFTVTPDNLLDTLMTWMPDQLDRMRQYASGTISIPESFATLECQYIRTVGGEKFRIVDVTPMGDSGSVYYEPLGQDDDIIIALGKRIESQLARISKLNSQFAKDKPVELKLVFNKGPFER